jgi:hypothetical protein
MLYCYFVPDLHFTHNASQDNAALAMIERSADAWEHNQFKDVIVRVANVEMYESTFPYSNSGAKCLVAITNP